MKVMLPSENVLAWAFVVGTKARISLLHSLCSKVDLPALSRPKRNHDDQGMPGQLGCAYIARQPNAGCCLFLRRYGAPPPRKRCAPAV